jgi:sigma-B regulation protein RsbU (phosphoserine phosphatase)
MTLKLSWTQNDTNNDDTLTMAKRSGLSIRMKVLLVLTLVPLMALSAYLYLVVTIFENDKIAYVYDTTSSVARSVAAQSRTQMSSVLNSLKPAIQEYINNGKTGLITNEIFQNEEDFESIVFWKLSDDFFTIAEIINKQNSKLTDWPNTLPDLQSWLKEAELRQRILKAPFDDDKIIFFERIGDLESNQRFLVTLIYKSRELSDIFNSNSNLRVYLTNDTGDILIGREKNSVKNLSLLLNKDLFKTINKKSVTDGTELVKNNKGVEYLLSYAKTGFSDLMVTSLIDKKSALSAIKVLLRKSLLFFGLLIFITLLVSILSSKTLTQALSDLFAATRKVAEGDFSFRLRIQSNDEVGSLAESFNLMSEEVSRLLDETAEKARMESELQTARTVQETLFPPNSASFNNVITLAGHYEPASECGGDWWYYTKMGNKILLCIGDATGHGAPAALITSAARSASSVLESFDFEPSEIMRLLNKSIYDVSKGKVMMTFFLGVINLDTLKMNYCNASHEFPYLLKNTNSPPKKKDLIPLLEVTSPRLGQGRDTTYSQVSIQMDPGDTFLFYTDGISEIRNLNSESFGERNFIKLILESLKDFPNPIVAVERFKGNLTEFRQNTPLLDDVTFFVLKCEGRK